MMDAKFNFTPEWHQLILLFLHEMHIQEDLVYDKHSGKLVGFIDLVEVNNQLLTFQSHIEGMDNIDNLTHLATSMLIIMMKGFEIPNVYFSLTGDLLFQLFWQTVGPFESIGF